MVGRKLSDLLEEFCDVMGVTETCWMRVVVTSIVFLLSDQ